MNFDVFLLELDAQWCNGNTSDFGSEIQGSSPCWAANMKQNEEVYNSDIVDSVHSLRCLALRQEVQESVAYERYRRDVGCNHYCSRLPQGKSGIEYR